MDTKLRNISRRASTKVIAFILVVICITAAVVELQYISYQNLNPELLFVKEYKNSNSFLSNEVGQVLYQTTSIIENNGNIPKLQDGDLFYYITDGEKTYSNSINRDRSFFEQFDNAFFAFENGIWTAGKNTNSSQLSSYYLDDKYTIYISFINEFMEENEKEWLENRSKLVPIVISMIVYLVMILFFLILLICVTGRKTCDEDLHMSWLDRIYSDILFTAFLPLAFLWLGIISSVGNYYIEQIYSMIGVGVLTAIVSTICGFILLSLVRKIKSGRLLRHTLIFTICNMVYDFLKSMFDGRIFAKYPLTKSLFYRQLIFITASAFLVFITFVFFIVPPLFLLPPILEIIIIYWYIKGNNKTFEDINEGFNESLEEQMKAERMKIALITNVSHDLKTPLTSIISYVDLLSKEDNLSDTASDYIKILSDKSDRLKNIVSDLFDLAKSTSGNINLDLETLDIKKLIEQTLADMEDKIEQSGLQIKTKLPDSPVNIFSDGKKLYRVFQNIIDNALKYSLVGSRVFVDLENNNGKAIATVKNTAGYEMNFTSDEILQRFNRGDKSRTTEGSGLGLSIAESFTTVCGGNFKVDIDGDLFKVTISFNIDH